MRTRLRIVYNEDTKLMYEHMDEGYGPFSMRDCEDVKIKEEIDCVGLPSCEISPSEARGICQLPKEEGPCSGNHTRWFFDTQSGTCQEFMYSGCRGNRNKFFSLEDCERTCKEYKEDENEHEDGGTTINPNFSDLTVLNSISDTSRPSTDPGETDDNVVHGRNGGKPCPKKLIRRKKCKRACNSDGVPDVNPTWGEAKPPIKVPSVDCILSEWTTWSPCSVTCGMNAVKQRTRSIIRLNSGGGFPCDIRLEIASCDVLPCLE
ncbi:hypothetical protein C0J52_09667 [Blattella germanica]|nr:hypothetical protein C0J52_09667 [Blattella germanica]